MEDGLGLPRAVRAAVAVAAAVTVTKGLTFVISAVGVSEVAQARGDVIELAFFRCVFIVGFFPPDVEEHKGRPGIASFSNPGSSKRVPEAVLVLLLPQELHSLCRKSAAASGSCGSGPRIEVSGRWPIPPRMCFLPLLTDYGRFFVFFGEQ